MIYITSDPHFNHANVIPYCNRPYSSVEEMNEALIANWNSVIKPEDTIYCLGDFSFHIRSVEQFMPRLNGKKILISGNHDWTHPANKKSRNPEKQAKNIADYVKFGWAEVHQELVLDLPGLPNIRMCHLPYSDPDPSQDQRYLKYRPVDDGKILLCGHVHNVWQTKISPNGTLMVNCGVDVWGMKPVSLDQIIALVTSQKTNK